MFYANIQEKGLELTIAPTGHDFRNWGLIIEYIRAYKSCGKVEPGLRGHAPDKFAKGDTLTTVRYQGSLLLVRKSLTEQGFRLAAMVDQTNYKLL